MGQSYASVAWSQELTPLVQGNLSVIGNLNDQSTMLSPSISISVSDNTQKLLSGGFMRVLENNQRMLRCLI